MSKVLILFAHPMMEKSRTQVLMADAVRDLKKVFLHDLYEAYPNFDVDVEFEKELLLSHDTIILQHPMYWYSAPALVKQWLDLVLEHGWAYGKKGDKLSGKKMLNALSTGGPQAAYHPEGFNRHTVRQFLAPFEQTARLCKMDYLPPYVVHASHRTSAAEKLAAAEAYREFVIRLTRNEIDTLSIKEANYSNQPDNTSLNG